MQETTQPPEDDRSVERGVFARVRALLSDKFGIASKSVELDSVLVSDLGIEPADMGYLALTLEEAFDVDIATEDVAHIVRVRDAVSCVLGLQVVP